MLIGIQHTKLDKAHLTGRAIKIPTMPDSNLYVQWGFKCENLMSIDVDAW